MAAKHEHNRHTIAGLFEDSGQAERVVRQLEGRGFNKGSIGIATRDRADRERLDQRTGIDVADSAGKAAKSAHHGVMDTIKSWFQSSSGTSDTDALTETGLSPQEAQDIERGLEAGMVLVVVDAGDRVDEVITIFGEDGSHLEQPTGTGTGTSDRDRANTASRPETRRMELRDEELEVQKRQREAGEVRIRKEVVSEERTIDVPVSREELVVERHPTEKRAASGDIDKGEEIRIPLREEEVDVQKRPVVREEVSIGKQKVQDTERVSETVRHEELQVGSEGDVRMRTSGTPEQRRPAYSGRERRRGRDTSYTGQERRAAMP